MTPPLLDLTHALFLDLDGTLIDLADRPDQVVLAPGVIETLTNLHAALDGAMALVTGRRLADADALLRPLRLPAAGLHGAEIREHPDTLPQSETIAGRALRELVGRLQASLAGDPDLWLEDKGAAAALHYRAAPARAAEARELMQRAVHGLGLDVIAGKAVFEARSPGIDKGTAVAHFMQRAPFSGRTPVFVGDDVTDEDGIAGAQSRGGFGVKVGTGTSAASLRLAGPAAVHAWLRNSLARLTP